MKWMSHWVNEPCYKYDWFIFRIWLPPRTREHIVCSCSSCTHTSLLLPCQHVAQEEDFIICRSCWQICPQPGPVCVWNVCLETSNLYLFWNFGWAAARHPKFGTSWIPSTRIFALYCVFRGSITISLPCFQVFAPFLILSLFTIKNTFFSKSADRRICVDPKSGVKKG